MIGTTIRSITIEDAPGVAQLVTELGYPTQPAEMSVRLSALLSDPCYSAFVAERRDLLAGMAGGRIGRYFEKNGLYAQLLVFVVTAGARRTGVGTALLNVIEEWAILKGATEMIVNSGSQRDDAHLFYEARGFRPTGLRFRKILT